MPCASLTIAWSGASFEIVTAPPEWLDRLLGVLLDNACKYSRAGGAVTVAVASEGQRIRLTVDDSGPGIPESELAFERPAEYARMKADGRLDRDALPPPDPKLVRRAYLVGGILMSIGIALLLLMLSTVIF